MSDSVQYFATHPSKDERVPIEVLFTEEGVAVVTVPPNGASWSCPISDISIYAEMQEHADNSDEDADEQVDADDEFSPCPKCGETDGMCEDCIKDREAVAIEKMVVDHTKKELVALVAIAYELEINVDGLDKAELAELIVSYE